MANNARKKENIYIPERAERTGDIAGHIFSSFITCYVLTVLCSVVLGFTLTLPMFLVFTVIAAVFMGFYLGFAEQPGRWMRAGCAAALFVVNAWFLFSSLPFFASPIFSGEGIFA